MTFLLGLGGIILSIVTFLFGKAFSQSERVLDQKRKVYEDFLLHCPAPNEAHDVNVNISIELQRQIGLLSIYGSADVAKYAGAYFLEFEPAREVLCSVVGAGHPKFIELMTHYNRMVWAMRTDAMMWSFFAPKKSARMYDTPASRQNDIQ